MLSYLNVYLPSLIRLESLTEGMAMLDMKRVACVLVALAMSVVLGACAQSEVSGGGGNEQDSTAQLSDKEYAQQAMSILSEMTDNLSEITELIGQSSAAGEAKAILQEARDLDEELKSLNASENIADVQDLFNQASASKVLACDYTLKAIETDSIADATEYLKQSTTCIEHSVVCLNSAGELLEQYGIIE